MSHSFVRQICRELGESGLGSGLAFVAAVCNREGSEIVLGYANGADSFG